MKNFDRQYRLAAGKAGSTGFEIGSGKRPLHVSFSVEKADTNSQNTAKVTIWNLSDEHLAELSKNDCVVVLHAGYGDTRPLIFTGVVTFATTKADGADRSTEIELVDNRIEVRDTYVSVSYSGAVNCKTLIQDTADQMGVTVSFSYNAEFKDIPNGYSYVGPARNVLTKACETSGLVWSINNGVLQVKKPGDATITRSAFNKATVILASPAATTALGVALNGNLYTITPDPKQSTSEALEALGTAITDKDFHVTVINDTIVIEAVDETSSNTLVLSENLTTASVGSIVTFETAEPGDIFIPNGVITKITKAVPGMESVVNVGSYVAGQLAESDVEFRKSYTNKIYNRSSAMLESIKSAILKNVQGVVSVAPYENCTNEVDSAGRWPHSIEVVVEGGDATEIAQQILNTKAGGINTFGSVETTLHGVYGEDIVVRFNRPTYVKVWFKVGVTLSPNTNPPTNYVELVKEQILEKMSVLGAGENVIPQKFNLQVSGIDYIDVWLFATPNDGDMPTGYTQRSVSISARERAVTDENRIEVVMDG